MVPLDVHIQGVVCKIRTNYFKELYGERSKGQGEPWLFLPGFRVPAAPPLPLPPPPPPPSVPAGLFLMLSPQYSLLLSKITLPWGATTLSEGLSHALRWVRWQQPEQAVSSPRQPQPLPTAPPLLPVPSTKKDTTLVNGDATSVTCNQCDRQMVLLSCPHSVSRWQDWPLGSFWSWWQQGHSERGDNWLLLVLVSQQARQLQLERKNQLSLS